MHNQLHTSTAARHGPVLRLPKLVRVLSSCCLHIRQWVHNQMQNVTAAQHSTGFPPRPPGAPLPLPAGLSPLADAGGPWVDLLNLVLLPVALLAPAASPAPPPPPLASPDMRDFFLSASFRLFRTCTAAKVTAHQKIVNLLPLSIFAALLHLHRNEKVTSIRGSQTPSSSQHLCGSSEPATWQG